jgi:hypothetical protein
MLKFYFCWLQEIEEHNRKTHKAKLYDANNNYTVFRNRDIVKVRVTELKLE